MSASKDLFSKAKTLYQEEDYEKALKLYQDLSREHPDNYRVWNNLGLCFTRLDDYKKAIVAFTKAIEVKHTKELIWSNLGKAYYHNGEYDKIIDTYEKALKFFPNNNFFWNGIGVAHIELGNFDEAIKVFKQMLEKNQEDHTAWNNLCLAYSKKGVEFSPSEFGYDNEVAWYQLSKKLLVAGLYEDSLDAINRALSINPSFQAATILKSKISLIIKEETLKNSDPTVITNQSSGIEKDTYYERFKKLQEKRKKLLNKPELQKELSLDQRFKKQQQKFRTRTMQIDDTLDFEPAKSDKSKKPIKQTLNDDNLIYINNKYHKLDECNFVIDGANVARASIADNKGGKISRLYKLFEKLHSFGIKNYLILCDRSLYYTIDHKKEYKLLVKNGRVSETPGGTEADHFILQYAKENDSYIISNDRFREFRKFFKSAWLNKRLITFKFIKDKLYFDKIYTTY